MRLDTKQRDSRISKKKTAVYDAAIGSEAHIFHVCVSEVICLVSLAL
jgi:hypothetical protein